MVEYFPGEKETMANSAMEMSPPWKHPVASKLLMVVLTVLFNFIPYCIYKVCFRQGFRIRDVAAGSNHSAAVTSSGELYTWGLGEYGRLGHGDNLTQLTHLLACFYKPMLLFFP